MLRPSPRSTRATAPSAPLPHLRGARSPLAPAVGPVRSLGGPSDPGPVRGLGPRAAGPGRPRTMNANIMTGRTTRGTPAPAPCPNTPNSRARAGTSPRGRGCPVADHLLPARELPPGAQCRGEVRLPLTLTTAPVAHLITAPGVRPVWIVRLPEADGTPRWRQLSRTEPLRWAIASRLPEVARAVVASLRRATSEEAWEGA